ncbi:unnamed protein product [Victoria cruziana]
MKGVVADQRISSSSLPLYEEGRSEFEFDAFISYAREDTAVNVFAGELNKVLRQRAVRTFFADEEETEDEREKVGEVSSAIEKSQIFIPIFSKSYANSRWRLMEIASIVNCRRLILPVFFDIDPRYVRSQGGPFIVPFRKHEEDAESGERLTSAWRTALRTSGEIKGYDIKNEAAPGQELKFIHVIVKRVLDQVNKIPLDIAKHPVGLEPRLLHLLKLLDLQSSSVRMVGIYGMGGIGKTTLAKAIYNRISSKFEAACFLSNIREVAKQCNGLISLQTRLVTETFNDKHAHIGSVSQGINLLKRRSRCKRVLIVLDDVDDEGQVSALAGCPEWFYTGSRIIITTRYSHVLHLQKLKNHDIYQLEELNFFESLQLFSYHAFGRAEPVEEYDELSKEIVSIASGLPLTLEVLGSLLFYQNSLADWEQVLHKLKLAQPEDVHQRLRISYDGLDDMEKQIFLDIACFFNRKGKEYALWMWKDCDLFPSVALTVLLQKSLVKLSEDKTKFEMHDQVEEMGRQIVREEGFPELRSRLWDADEALNMLEGLKGTSNVEGIVLQLPKNKMAHLSTEAFRAMCKLRLLHVDNVGFEGEYRHFPKTLKWFEWIGCPLESLPCDLHLEKAVVLDLSSSMITQVWKQQGLRTMAFDKLKVLNLHNCVNLTICPNFTRLRSLEKLVFDHCHKLAAVDESIGHLKHLVHLSMRSCLALKELPSSVCHLTSLQMLDLYFCPIVNLLEDIGDLQSLKQLILEETDIITLPASMSNMKKLIFLSLRKCKSLTELPEWIGRLEFLRDLILEFTCLETIPASVGLLVNLQTLNAIFCRFLLSLPDSICNLKNLRKLQLDDAAIQWMPKCVGSLEKLEVLSMAGCVELEALLPSIGLLKNLKRLSAAGDEYTCSRLKVLPEDIGELTDLTYLDISYNPHLAVVPSSFFNLSSLEILKAVDCNWIQRIDIDSLGKLSSLKELDLRFSDGFCSLPSCIAVLPQLERLDLEHCGSLTFLPQLPSSLVRLSARCCSALEMMSDLLKLGRCRSLSDSQRCRIKEARFRHLSEFSISGSPSLGRSSDTQLLSFFPQKRLKCVSLYLEVSGNFEDGEGISVHVEVVKNHYTISETISQVTLCKDPLKLDRNEPMLIKLQEGERTGSYAENDNGIMHVSIDRGLLLGADVKFGADETFADSYVEYLQHGNYSFYRYEAMDMSVDGSSQNTKWYCRLVFEQQLDWSRLHHPEGCWRHL